VSAGSSRHILSLQCDQLGDTEARLDRDQEEHPIAAAGPCRLGRSVDQGLDLTTTQEGDGASLVPLVRHRENALAVKRVGGLADGDVAEEGPDGCQTHVSGARAVAAGALEMVEETADETGVEVFDAELRR